MHVHANAAVSVDGKLATTAREQVAISGPDDFARVDRLRATMDAVMVGIGTVLADDPSLTVPSELAEEGQPARVVVDTAARTPPDARVCSAAAPTYCLVGAMAPADRRQALEDAGVTVIETASADRVALAEGLDALEAAGIDRVLLEGGGRLMFSMFAAELIDTLTLFTSPAIIGGESAPTLVDGDGFDEQFPALVLEDIERLDTGLLCRYVVDGWRDDPAGT